MTSTLSRRAVRARARTSGSPVARSRASTSRSRPATRSTRSCCVRTRSAPRTWRSAGSRARDSPSTTTGEIHDLTIRSFGVLRPSETPPITVTIVDDPAPPRARCDRRGVRRGRGRGVERARSTRYVARAQEVTMPVESVPTPNAPPAAGPYSPAVRAGDWLVLAGQVGLDPAGGGIVPGGVEPQARQALANITAVLARLRRATHRRRQDHRVRHRHRPVRRRQRDLCGGLWRSPSGPLDRPGRGAARRRRGRDRGLGVSSPMTGPGLPPEACPARFRA